MFFGSAAHGRRDRRRCSPASTSSSSGAARRPGRPTVSGRVFKIERTAVGRARRVRPPVRRHAPAAPARPRRGRGGGEADVDQGVRPGRRAAARRPRAPGEMATVRGLGAVRVGDAIGEPPPGEDGDRALPASGARGRRVPAPAGAVRAASGRPSPSSPSRTRSSTSARTTTATRSRSRSTARCRRRSSRRRSSASTASPPTSARRRRCASSGRHGVGEAEEVIRAKTNTNITGRSSPLSTNPFRATLALRIEPAPFGSGIAFRTDVEAAPRPALHLQDARGVRDPDGGVRPRGARPRGWPAGR